MLAKKCRSCGFPQAISRMMKWNDNGTITLWLRRDFRAVLIEADFLNELFEHIEVSMGFSIRHIVFAAQRNAAREVAEANIRGPFSFARYGPFKQVSVRLLCRVASFTGQSSARVVAYKGGKYGEALVLNPFDRDLMAAVIVGIFDGLERKPFGHAWRETDRGDIITVKPEPSRPELVERMAFTTPPPIKGDRAFQRCPRCGVPARLEDLEWLLDEGKIVDRRLKERMVLLDCYTPSVVIRELASELGDSIYPLVVEAQRSYSLRHIRRQFLAGRDPVLFRNKQYLYENVLETVALRGLGNPTGYLYAGDRLMVTVENPFNPHLLAGHLAAMYELGEKQPAGVGWDYLDENTIRFTMAPRHAAVSLAV
jgi:hypothetical protein